MMRTVFVFVFAALVGLIIQAVLVHGFAPSAIAPDFITLLVAYIGLRHRNVPGVLGAFALGILEDFASAQFVGPNAGGAVVAFLVTVFVSDKIYAERAFALFGIVFIASLLKCATFLSMIAIYVDGDLFLTTAFWTSVTEALFTAGIAPVVLRLLQPNQTYSSARQLTARESLRWSV